MSADKMLRVRDVAERLGQSPQWVYARCYDGTFEYRRQRGSLRIAESVIVAYENRTTVKARKSA